MRRLIIIALLLICGQAAAAEQIISVQHDSVRGVTCWILNNTGISCLPDSSFQRQQQATPSSEAGRAFQAGPAPEIGPSVAGSGSAFGQALSAKPHRDGIAQMPAGTTTDETQAPRASLAKIEGENGQFPATPLPQKNGFQL